MHAPIMQMNLFLEDQKAEITSTIVEKLAGCVYVTGTNFGILVSDSFPSLVPSILLVWRWVWSQAEIIYGERFQV